MKTSFIATSDVADVDAPVFRPFRSLQEHPAEPDWIWRGYLAPGALTLLAGHPFAGKSMLVGGLMRALADARPFLGKDTIKASALLVTEEDDSVLRERAELLGLLDIDGGFMSRNSGASRHSWPGLVTAATDQAVMEGHSLLVFDTFPGLAQLGDDQENDAGAITERLRPLQTAASLGLSVLFLHHMNAYGQPRGSRALRGIADIVVLFRRDRGNEFHLDADSRYPTATPSRLRGRLMQGSSVWSYEAVNSTDKGARSPQFDEADSLLRAALADAGSDGLGYDEIAALPGLSIGIAKRRLPEWLEKNDVRREGAGTKGYPYRWFPAG